MVLYVTATSKYVTTIIADGRVVTADDRQMVVVRAGRAGLLLLHRPSRRGAVQHVRPAAGIAAAAVQRPGRRP